MLLKNSRSVSDGRWCKSLFLTDAIPLELKTNWITSRSEACRGSHCTSKTNQRPKITPHTFLFVFHFSVCFCLYVLFQHKHFCHKISQPSKSIHTARFLALFLMERLLFSSSQNCSAFTRYLESKIHEIIKI